jgi:hypothetical protein
MLARLEAADTRIQVIQAFAVVFTFGVPAVAKALNPSVSFESGRLHLALFCFAASMIVGIVGQARGSVRLANPALIYRNWLHFSEWELKKKAVYWAGEHFEINGALVRSKANVSLVMVVLILIELLFLFTWLMASGARPG